MAGRKDEPATPEDVARLALKQLLRGGSFEALAREIAWRAVHAAGANYATIDWLAPLIAERLGAHVDGLEFGVDMASVRARARHRQLHPGDTDGADTAAALVGREYATRELETIYQSEVEWAARLIADRLDSGRQGEKHSPLAVRRRRAA